MKIIKTNSKHKIGKHGIKMRKSLGLTSPYDPNGSYTGTPLYNDYTPTQDADDL
ncbi:MAG: hypothetical protein ACI4MI_00175 [Christensenellales bacterium]